MAVSIGGPAFFVSGYIIILTPLPNMICNRLHSDERDIMAPTPAVERMRKFRQRQRAERTRIDGWISSSASWRLKKLAAAWGVSRGAVIDRLLLEADSRYQEILFPDLDD